MRPPTFTRHVLVVTGIHLGVLSLVIVLSVLPGCASLPPPNTPVELIVEIPEHEAGPDTPPEQKTDPKAAPEAPKDLNPQPKPPEHLKQPPEAPKDDDALPEIKPKPIDKPKPLTNETVKAAADKKPKKIEISKKLVRHTVNLPASTSKRKTTLTPDEIRSLLERGATAGRRATFSDADMHRVAASDTRFGHGAEMTRDLLYGDQIKQRLIRAWTQPRLDISGLVTKVQISLRADGRLVNSTIVKASGNPVMDQSVMDAVHSVALIPGLPGDWLAANPKHTITFTLERQ